MTDTLSEREKELVEAARMVTTLDKDIMNGVGLFHRIDNLNDALKAYDPKPEPVPVIPSWEELSNDQRYRIGFTYGPDTTQAIYERIRCLTARMPD